MHATATEKTNSDHRVEFDHLGEALGGFTEAIKTADSPELALELLKKKQAALELLHPRKPLPERVTPATAQSLYTTRNGDDWRRILAAKQTEDRRRQGGLTQVTSSDLPATQRRATLRHSPKRITKRVPAATGKIRKLRNLEPAKLTAQEPKTPEPEGEMVVSYSNGLAMSKTTMIVSTRLDLSAKAKAVALALAMHAPHVQPSKARLSRLTSLSVKTVSRALIELRDHHLVTWKAGAAHESNVYVCNWLYAV